MVPLSLGVGSSQEDPPRRQVGVARPDLLARHDPLVAITDCGRGER